VIPNSVTPARSLADPVGKDTKILLNVGGFRPEKDHQTLIRAFAGVASSHPDWRLRLIGGGPLGEQLKELAMELGVSDRVQFPGTTKDVEGEYSAAQLFVLPSRYEAFPNCLAEALAHGLPAVGFSNCPGTRDLIVDGVNGRLVRGEDRIAALSAELGRMFHSPQTRQEFGAAAPASVAPYSLNSVIDRWESLLTAVATPCGSK
jgi:glycosyltransferase involved in cell wall biosynthesis